MRSIVVLLATALLASASPAILATITAFAGAGCTGAVIGIATVSPGQCFTLGRGSAKSMGYEGVPNEIDFFVSGGEHDNCSSNPTERLAGLSGCATANDGINWESARFF